MTENYYVADDKIKGMTVLIGKHGSRINAWMSALKLGLIILPSGVRVVDGKTYRKYTVECLYRSMTKMRRERRKAS